MPVTSTTFGHHLSGCLHGCPELAVSALGRSGLALTAGRCLLLQMGLGPMQTVCRMLREVLRCLHQCLENRKKALKFGGSCLLRRVGNPRLQQLSIVSPQSWLPPTSLGRAGPRARIPRGEVLRLRSKGMIPNPLIWVWRDLILGVWRIFGASGEIWRTLGLRFGVPSALRTGRSRPCPSSSCLPTSTACFPHPSGPW